MILAVIQSTVVLVIALCTLPFLRRQSAATRHAALTVGLIFALAVPVVSPLLPSWQAAERFGGGVGGKNPGQTLFSTTQENLGLTRMFSLDASLESLPPHGNAPSAAAIMFGIWIGGVAVAGILLVAGAARIGWLMLKAETLRGSRWITAVAGVSHGLKLTRQVPLLYYQGTILGTWGVLRPRVLLARDADNWSDDRLRVVLAHELAHIKRFDWLVQMLAEFARAVYWFNPLFWILCRRLRSESEYACDDVVLNLGIDAKDYAAQLLELARTLKSSGRAWSPVLAMAQPPNLERRFLSMLNPSLNHRPITRSALLVACIVASCVTLPLAAMRAPEQVQPAVSAVPSPSILATPSSPAPKVAVLTAPSVAVRKSPAPKPAPVQGLADGSLSGTVYDGSGAVVVGVTLTVSSMVTAPRSVIETEMQTTISGAAGEYQFRALPAGQYSLKGELPGFMTFRTARLEIKPSQTLRQNVTLSVGGVAERVTVTAVGQPKPAPLPGTPQRIRVGGNVQAARLIGQVKPIYPQSARDAGIEGTVRLQGLIGADGTLIGLSAISGIDANLTNAALEAVRQWRYKPTLLNNVPVEILTTIDVEFRLAQ